MLAGSSSQRGVRFSGEFELSEFKSAGSSSLQGVRVSGEFELSEFESAGFYCI